MGRNGRGLTSRNLTNTLLQSTVSILLSRFDFPPKDSFLGAETRVELTFCF